jgi:hypothetical protein
MDFKYTAGKDSFYVSNADLSFASNIVTGRTAVFDGLNTSNLLNNMFGETEGGGFGADIGATYTRYVGGDEEDGHKLTASVSIVDIGAINYKKDNYTLYVTGEGYLSGAKLSDYKNNYDSLKAYARRQHFLADTGTSATKVHMPTALIISGDYQVYNHFYVNALYVANLINRQNFGNSVYNQLTVTPRYDSKIFSAGLPITYNSLANDLKLGLGMRLGGFFMGSDDMLALFSSNQYGFGFYFGGYIPIGKKSDKHSKESIHSAQ